MSDATPSIPVIPIGAHVTSRPNPAWGKGIAMSREGKLVRVLFVSHPSRKPVNVPAASLAVERGVTWPDPAKVMAGPAAGPKAKVKGPRKLAPPRRTREEAIRYFLELFPGAFEDPGYLAEERGYKLEAHRLYTILLGADLDRLVQAGDGRELAERAKKVEASTNLLFRLERARFRPALDDPERTLALFRALSDLLAATDREEAFTRWVKALEALPNGGRRLVTWPVATLLPYLARPDEFVFLKPNATKESAARYELDLRYSAFPSWTTYGQLQKLVELLRKDLDPMGCRDLIDVQSFIWRTF